MKVFAASFHIFCQAENVIRRNKDRRNVWQATKHQPCRAVFAPNQSFSQKGKRQKNLKANHKFNFQHFNFNETKKGKDFTLFVF